MADSRIPPDPSFFLGLPAGIVPLVPRDELYDALAWRFPWFPEASAQEQADIYWSMRYSPGALGLPTPDAPAVGPGRVLPLRRPPASPQPDDKPS